ncbi:MAG: Type II secretion system protein F [Chlamydiia bacterium]|nr:Type II secretion system protein F [Chlamydiia bacterium]MCH9616320.1 Type II secretion system protein F [Chlamydiia bacterium]MCH9629694.1 Type II secretion system protein F [Chlamydiia bacterium]
MALFKYEALAVSGKRMNGTIDADSLALAKDKLKRQEVFVTKLTPLGKKSRESIISPAMRIAFTRDLASLLRSGLPLYESLVTIEEKYTGHKCHPLFLSLCDRVKKGEHLSQALAAYPKSFDRVYIAMVRAAEETARLEEVFNELALLTSKTERLKKQVTTAMIYPTFLLAFAVIVITALMFFLIPSMQDLFEGRTLHPVTMSVLAVSHFLIAHQVTIAVGLLSIVAIIVYAVKKRLFFDQISLALPLIKRIKTQMVCLRFSRVLSVLLKSGVPLLDALGLAKQVLLSRPFEEVIEKAEKSIVEGGKLSEELRNSPLIPKLFVRMLEVSEEAGNLPDMLKNIAEIYEEDLEKSLSRFTTLIQPVMLLVLGFFVGIILLSVLLPLTDVSSIME